MQLKCYEQRFNSWERVSKQQYARDSLDSRRRVGFSPLFSSTARTISDVLSDTKEVPRMNL